MRNISRRSRSSKTNSGEYVSRKGRQVFVSRDEFKRMNELSYGIWECEDGRQVLFNRFYEPIYERRPGEPARPADPHERIGRAYQRWFYIDDARSERDKMAAARRALDEWLAAP